MIDIELIEGLSIDDAKRVCLWTNEKGEEFLRRWAGPGVEFPLNEDLLLNFENTYSIQKNGEFIGLIRKIRQVGTNVHIGNFILNPEYVGRGFGKIALKKFIDSIFLEQQVETITLNVFAYNKNAIELYKKCGFKVLSTITQPIKKYSMVRSK
ncbi:GNAT family N-acetyltransferase [Gemella morbillorum]|uniref:GNAT family N-acetyltransferase n=1 Tax=Gemella morbillorum TaxID=29391 RepID=UPI0028D42AFD|nr:GNAT family N-acetyltransferase [Gemella morbillorum]